VKPGTPTLRSFVFLAYGLTWVLLGPWFYVLNVVHQGQVPSWLWALAPLAFLGGWGPSVAALIVTARAGGRSAVRRLVGSLAIWRVPMGWYLVTLTLPPLAGASCWR